jgi:hypothetical protein
MGCVALSLLPWKDKWSCVYNVRSVLLSIQVLFALFTFLFSLSCHGVVCVCVCVCVCVWCHSLFWVIPTRHHRSMVRPRPSMTQTVRDTRRRWMHSMREGPINNRARTRSRGKKHTPEKALASQYRQFTCSFHPCPMRGGQGVRGGRKKSDTLSTLPPPWK